MITWTPSSLALRELLMSDVLSSTFSFLDPVYSFSFRLISDLMYSFSSAFSIHFMILYTHSHFHFPSHFMILYTHSHPHSHCPHFYYMTRTLIVILVLILSLILWPQILILNSRPCILIVFSWLFILIFICVLITWPCMLIIILISLPFSLRDPDCSFSFWFHLMNMYTHSHFILFHDIHYRRATLTLNPLWYLNTVLLDPEGRAKDTEWETRYSHTVCGVVYLKRGKLRAQHEGYRQTPRKSSASRTKQFCRQVAI